MDSGFVAPGDSPEDDYDVMRTLLPKEVIGIMDQLLCYEASVWLCFGDGFAYSTLGGMA